MMKKILTLLLVLLVTSLSYTQVRHSTAYDYPLLTGSSVDSVLNGLKSIRGCYFETDMDGDGKSEIGLTNYFDQGHVHLFETVGNDSIKLVWSSPKVASAGGGSTPRYVLFGDLDNDGKKEIIFQSSGNGIFIFEWDGVVGSDNYGTIPSQVINSTTLPEMTGVSGSTEYMEIDDIDTDGQNELCVFYNSSPNANDKFFIISAIGDWNTNDPGFSGFTAEYSKSRVDLINWGMNGGTPYSMHIAQFDGAGNKELLFQAWNFKNVSPVRIPTANTYLEADTTIGKQNYFLTGTYDDVALFGGGTFDIDKDGREEVYLPNYHATGSPYMGTVHMISYNSGESTTIIDSTNVTTLNFKDAGVLDDLLVTFGFGYGDIDKDGKPNIYTSSTYGSTGCNVLTAEFQGGDKRNLANWTFAKLYRGDPTIYTTRIIKDSLGNKDTTLTIDNAFASKIFARYTDFDKDGFEDILLPYQALSDSVTHITLTWNSGTSKFDSVSVRAANPKRWSFRIIEGTISTGVEAKDLTVITPDDYELYQNYPNPFNPSTEISFFLPITDKISLKIYNQLGQEVKTLIAEKEHINGRHSVVWDGMNNFGGKVSSGIYIAQLKFGNFSKEIKMMMIK
ncbi:MAG: T9SS type A sorting domain-containing protein [Ignavibacteria bacterium]|nr:T9SS type A sorting domain-containing protein [Ignavibacteria bacterium]